MTTNADVRAFVQPFVDRHPDLALVRRIVVVRPVTHVLRGFFIDGWHHPDYFKTYWGREVTFIGRGFLTRFFASEVDGDWSRLDAGNREELFEIFEKEALPKLRAVRSIDDFNRDLAARQGSPPYITQRDEWQFVMAVATGDLDTARRLAPTFRARAGWLDKTQRWEHSRHEPMPMSVRISDDLVPHLDAGDLPALARSLWGWESELIGWLGLRKLWVREPFPLEVKYGLEVWKQA